MTSYDARTALDAIHQHQEQTVTRMCGRGSAGAEWAFSLWVGALSPWSSWRR